MRDTSLRDDLGSRAFDVFCPASFLHMLPWIASLQLLFGVGVDTIAEWDQRLVERFAARLDAERYRLVSPQRGSARSTLVVVSDARGDAKRLHHRLKAAGIDLPEACPNIGQ
jgi:hypothetical protein